MSEDFFSKIDKKMEDNLMLKIAYLKERLELKDETIQRLHAEKESAIRDNLTSRNLLGLSMDNNETLKYENKQFKEALANIFIEAGEVVDGTWPAQQLVCFLIAERALTEREAKE